MATYNGAKFLEAQLESILSQLRDEDELIISDDGSDDGTLAILRELKGHNISVFENHFRNPVLNFQFTLERSRKPVVCFSDQDDIWLPNKRKVMAEHLEGTTTKLLLMNGEIIDENGNTTGESTFEKWRIHGGFRKNLLRNTFMGSSMAFTSDIKKWILPFPKDIAMHDWWIGLLAEKLAEVERTPEKTIQYRIHGNNASLGGSSAFLKLKWRFQMFQAVQERIRKVKPGL